MNNREEPLVAVVQFDKGEILDDARCTLLIPGRIGKHSTAIKELEISKEDLEEITEISEASGNDINESTGFIPYPQGTANHRPRAFRVTIGGVGPKGSLYEELVLLGDEYALKCLRHLSEVCPKNVVVAPMADFSFEEQ